MHAFSAEHFVGPELFTKVISRRHLDSNCEHRIGAEKKLSLYSRVAKAHDNTHCYPITHTHTHTKRARDYTDLGVKM